MPPMVLIYGKMSNVVSSERTMKIRIEYDASMLEIYNETIRDLLSPNRSTSSCLTLLNKQYTIKHNLASNTHVPDLTVVDVCSIKEISFLLDQATRSKEALRGMKDIFRGYWCLENAKEDMR
ncbi:hypothetical protein HPP92_006244, partial [Vanilla planifolia]